MKTKNNLVTVLALSLVGLAGCSAKVSGGTSPTDLSSQLPGFTNPTTTTPAKPAPVQAAATVLEGRWVLACSQVPGLNLYTSGEADFSGNTYSTIANVFMDSQCQHPMGNAQTQSGSFTIPEGNDINFVQSTGEDDYNIFEIDQKVLYIGLQSGISPSDRPQTVERSLSYTYAGAAVIVSN